jgi:hypothetical protein
MLHWAPNACTQCWPPNTSRQAALMLSEPRTLHTSAASMTCQCTPTASALVYAMHTICCCWHLLLPNELEIWLVFAADVLQDSTAPWNS